MHERTSTVFGHRACTTRAPVAVSATDSERRLAVTGVVRNAECIALMLLMAGALPTAAQQTAQSAVTLQVTGSFPNNGSFAGTLTINRFEDRGSQIVAIGFVQGTLSRANRVIGTALAGQIAWPVS